MNGAIISSTVRASSALIDQLVQKRVGSPVLTRTKQFDKLNRLSGISSVSSVPSVVNSASYGFNSANQRTRLTESDGKFWDFDYDPLGQVTSGVKKLADTTPVLGHSFGYSFDTIGNLNATAVNGQSATYAPDTAGLNQYASRTVPAALDIIGTAEAGAKVAVNLAPAQRQGDLFYKQLPVANASVAKWQPIDVLAGKAGAGVGGADADIRQSGHLFLAKTPESFTYDLDGNLTGDGQWSYMWDAENRLTTMETQASAATAGVPKQQLEFTYDFTGRRIAKRVYSWIPATSLWSPVSDIRFLYDGWNLLAEFNALSSNAVIRSYVWGIDLSGSSQGAGGVGGLLAATTYNQSPLTYLPVFDGNGNVTALIDSTTGARSATYVYGPFGESIAAYGPAAAANPLRFSTKYTDGETGLVYYGHRWYNPSTGRFLSKDPIEEQGGANLYGFVANNPVSDVDALGLWKIEFARGIDHLTVEANYASGGGNSQYDPDYSQWATGGTSSPQPWADGSRSPLSPPSASSGENSITVGVYGYTNHARWSGRKLSSIQWSGELVYDIYITPEIGDLLVCSAKFEIETAFFFHADPGASFWGNGASHAFITIHAGPNKGKKVGLVHNSFLSQVPFGYDLNESVSFEVTTRTKIATIDVGHNWHQDGGDSIIANARSFVNVEVK